MSIIIPLYVIEPRFFRDLDKFKRLNYKNYEILVVCDRKVHLPRWKKLKLVITGRDRTGPAEKRDLAILKARGEICAFIDDDAYPDPNWLKNGVASIKGSVIAVGGPGMTPPDDSYWEKLSGLVYESKLCSGQAQHRFLPGQPKYISDWPAYNLLVKTSALKQVGGYGNNFYGGEDTFLCLKLIKTGRIFYNPKMVVFHHRRPLFKPLLQQIYNIGVHRGYFAKKFPETSLMLFYFLPSFLAIGFIAMVIGSTFNPQVLRVFLISFSFLFSLAFFSVAGRTNIAGGVLVSAGIISTHLTYGIGFIRGLLTSNLSR